MGVGFEECGIGTGACGDVGDVGPEVVEVEVGIDGDGAVVADDGQCSACSCPSADEVVCIPSGLGGGDGFEFVGGEGSVDVSNFILAEAGGVGQPYSSTAR